MPPSFDDLASLFQLMGAAVFQTEDGTGGVTFLNAVEHPSLRAFAGTCHPGESFWEASIPSEDLPNVLSTLRAVASDGRPRTVEHRLVMDGGPGTWVRTSVRVAGDGSTGSISLLGAMMDVTTSHENERQWREVESWLVALGEALPFDFWICDAGGRYVLQNPASIRRIGNVVGLRGDGLSIPPGERLDWEQSFDLAMRGAPVRQELTVERGGMPCHLVRVVTPLRNWAQGEGHVDGVLGVDLDVTQAKEAERKLRASLEALNRTQDELVRKSQLAAIGEMAAVMAHEVRNPLTAIGNALTVLRRGAPDRGNEATLLSIMVEEAKRIEWLVASLLEFARPMLPMLEPGSLAEVVQEALAQTLTTEDATGKVRVERTWDPHLPPVLLDPRLLNLALTNVIRNAVQAMRGGGDLLVEIRRETEGAGAWARIVIRDSGPGISAEHQDRVFEPFFTTRPTGTGLGLPIVKRVIHEHSGTVELTSATGAGTTCCIRLPLAERGDAERHG